MRLWRPAAIVWLAYAGTGWAQERVIETQAGPIRVEVVARGLENPWGIAFLPERPGRLRVVSADGSISDPVAGVPEVFARGQGGLLDVALDPAFESNRLVYLSYAEPGQGGAGTAVARGRLNESAVALEQIAVIFRQQPKVEGPNHFGSRLVFGRDGALFVTLAERFKFDPAQDISNHLGTIVRINPDGTAPSDNPFVGRPGARPEIWSYGHRNIQGAALHPESGILWANEMGPRGGDELNIPEAGRNYGWPLVSWGEHYSGEDIPDPPTRPDLAQPIHHWTPVISPTGMIFYSGELFSAWRGDLLMGSLSTPSIVRVSLDGQRITGEERISLGTPSRDVAEGPDGAVYVLTDKSDGEVLRLVPSRP